MRIILAILFMILYNEVPAQIKLYGFTRESSSGIRPATADSLGSTTVQAKKTSTAYLLYIEIPKDLNIVVTELWIKGQRFGFDTATVQSPVILNTGLHMPGQKDSILVPKTEGRLIRIIPVEKITSSYKRKRTEDEVIICFKQNKRTKKITLQELTHLPPELGQ